MSKRSDIAAERRPGRRRGRPPRSRPSSPRPGRARRAPDAGRGRLIFALDATMSRQPTWDLACQLQAAMFDAAAARRRPRGAARLLPRPRRGAAPRAGSPTPPALKRLMTGIACHGGLTQIGRVLDHAVRAAAKAPVAALVFVGDAMEENVDALCHKAGELGLRNTRAFMFHEGGDPAAAGAFREIARLTGGAYLPFDARAAGELARPPRRGRRLCRRRPRRARGRRHRRRAAAPRRPRAMTAPLWAALLLARLRRRRDLVLPRLPPRQALAAVVLAAAAGLALLRLFALAVPLAALGIGLWRSAGATPAPGGRSEVESPAPADDASTTTSGAMDGEVTAGAFAGRPPLGALRRRSAGARRRIRGRRATRTAWRCSSPGSTASGDAPRARQPAPPPDPAR